MLDTLQSDEFWEGLDEIYVDTISQVHEFYGRRHAGLETFLEGRVVPAVELMITSVEVFANDVAGVFDSVAAEIRKLEIGPIAEAYILEPLIEIFGKHYMACYTRMYGKPDFQMLESMNPKMLTNGLYRLIFSNWPQDELVPEGTDTFVTRFVDGFWLIVTSWIGACP